MKQTWNWVGVLSRGGVLTKALLSAVVMAVSYGSSAKSFNNLIGTQYDYRSAPDSQLFKAFKALQLRFHYRQDPKGKNYWEYLPEVGKVRGDCEDFALTLQREVGGDIWLVKPRDKGIYHVVLCVDDLCVDNQRESLFTLHPARFSFMRKVPASEVQEILDTQHDLGSARMTVASRHLLRIDELIATNP